MDKKEFYKINREVLRKYGFVKNNNYYYLHLDEITLYVHIFSTSYGTKHFNFGFSFNELDNTTDPPTNVETKRYDLLIESEIELFPFNGIDNLYGSARITIEYEDYDEEYYREALTKALHTHFDWYKVDAKNHIKNTRWKFALSKPANTLLGIYNRTKWEEYYTTQCNFYEMIGEYLNAFLKDCDWAFDERMQEKLPLLPEMMALEWWFDFRQAVDTAEWRRYLPRAITQLLKDGCSNFRYALEKAPELLTFEAMRSNSFWEKQKDLAKNVLKFYETYQFDVTKLDLRTEKPAHPEYL